MPSVLSGDQTAEDTLDLSHRSLQATAAEFTPEPVHSCQGPVPRNEAGSLLPTDLGSVQFPDVHKYLSLSENVLRHFPPWELGQKPMGVRARGGVSMFVWTSNWDLISS